MSTTVEDGGRSPSYDELVVRVDELEAANARLRAEADRDGLVMNSSTDFAIITLDLGGRVIGWNVGAECLLGHTEQEMLGLSGAMVFTREDRAAGVFINELWRAFEHGSANNERWHVRRDGSRFWASGTMMPLLDTDGLVCGFLNIMRDGTAAVRAREHDEFLLLEARHKAKNTFATVCAVVARDAGARGVPGAALQGKLSALARSHDLLEMETVTLKEVVERSLAPYEGASGTVWTAGPPVCLDGKTGAALNSVLHELATNAAKYGAFSVPGGRVEVAWAVEEDTGGEPAHIAILWGELDGPPVVPPVRRGFGTRVIEGRLAREGGTVQLEFREPGVRCCIRLPWPGVPV